jgi:plastocyanin
MKTLTSYFKQISFLVLGLVIAFNTLTASASAATYTVKMGSDKGALVFEPKDIIIQSGDTIKWVNNKAFPHNIIVQGEAELSHKKLLVKPAAEVESTFTTAGEYSYYCTPHRGAGMVGKVTVQG